MSRSSPRSSRCISNSSARSRRSPTPRRRSSSGSSRAAPRCSTATIRSSRASSAARRHAGVARIVSFGEHASADARLIKCSLQSGLLDRAGATSSAPTSPTSSARPAGISCSTRSPCWRRRRSSAPISRSRRWRSPSCSRRPAAARASTLDVPGGTALLIDESYNANPASMRAALALLGQAPSRARAAGASRCSATCWSSGRSGADAAPRPRRGGARATASISCSAAAR